MFHAFLFSYVFVFKTDCQTHADNFQTRFSDTVSSQPGLPAEREERGKLKAE